jgi:tetratricopeptide (TPR) repeat protein
LNTKCLQLDTISTMMKEKQEGLQKTVAAMAKKVTAAKKKVPAAEKRLKTAQEHLANVNKAIVDTQKEHEEAQTKLDKHNDSVTTMNKVHRELSNEKETIASDLGNINSMHGEASTSCHSSSSSSTSYSSSSSVGSKRGRSSSSSSSSSASSSSSSSRTSKHQKKEGTTMTKHAGQWLFEEGYAYRYGLDFKKQDQKRGRLMIEASVFSGFPTAVAFCHYQGWMLQSFIDTDEEFVGIQPKYAHDLFEKIEDETNGYHWAQNLLGDCYRYGLGATQDHTKAFEWFTKSSEQGNSDAMRSLGGCYENGHGCVQNDTKAMELYEKSAKLGYSAAMYNIGVCYEYDSQRGATKDLNKFNQAREWYTKAIAQGHENSIDSSDLFVEQLNNNSVSSING